MNDHLTPRLDTIENFPGWQRAPAFLEKEIVRREFRSIADLGGGANPMLSEAFVRTRQLHYSVLDISREELEKAPGYCEKIQVDLSAPPGTFRASVKRDNFDMVFTHMLLEHLKEPLQAHRNIHSLLRVGGVAIHFYPSSNNFPLAINRLMPERLTQRLVRLSQPERDLTGVQGKFPAYYKLCGNPSRTLHACFEHVGFKVIQHTGYIGHGYYNRFAVAREIELLLRRLLLRARVPLTSAMLLVLEKQ